EFGEMRTYGQIVNKDGSTVDFVASLQSGEEKNPVVTALHGGRFLVTWQDFGSNIDIHGQVFNADGSRHGDEFVANTTTADAQHDPAVTVLSDGRFVVAWHDGDVHAQVFNDDGTMSGAEFLVNTAPDGPQSEASVAALADGRFVVTWTDLGSASDGS